MTEFEFSLYNDLLDCLLDRDKVPNVCFSGEENDNIVIRDLEVLSWFREAEIFSIFYLKNHIFFDRIMNIFNGHETMDDFTVGDYRRLFALLSGLRVDKFFIDKIRDKTGNENISKKDVFISHANKDKPVIVDKLVNSLNKLGVDCFYDTDSIKWGDNWKQKILQGTQEAEFAIIVISENFFGREWTEKELNEFLNRQNSNGQKLILPILHNISIDDLQRKYPNVADIQAIDSSKHTCDEIAFMFAEQLIKRLKSLI